MGGRGSSSGLAAKSAKKQSRFSKKSTTAKTESKTESKKVETNSAKASRLASDNNARASIVDWIYNQTGVDINKYRDKTTQSFDGRNGIAVDWKGMPSNLKAKIQKVSTQYKGGTQLELNDYGAWMKYIRMKSPKTAKTTKTTKKKRKK